MKSNEISYHELFGYNLGEKCVTAEQLTKTNNCLAKMM